ncbi:MAG: fatty acid desaturase [Actinomycetota bacterium]|nr:fatty acid desaturase [Actinomycetota bacterium]
MADTMVPDVVDRPDVLPTDRLQANGMCRPELRAELRRIAGVRNAWTVTWLWLWVAATVAVVARFPYPWVVVVAFVLMGPVHARLAILMHEAAHKLLFVHKRVNDVVGRWLIAAPALVPIALYRRGHFAHHRAEFGPDDPDIAYYGGYPTTRRTLLRRLTRDAVGISGWKNFKPLLRASVRPATRRVALPIVGVQAVLWAASWAATGDWWIYPVLWWLPWMTQWRVLNRLRSLAEHGGMAASDDRRATTHDVRQSWIARFWFVPYHAGWHLAHHVDMGIPWRNLPRYHEELRRAGYVTPTLTRPSYRALWRALSSEPAA